MAILKQFQRKDSAFNFVQTPPFLADHPDVYILQTPFHYDILDSPTIRKPLQVVAVWINAIKILDRSELFPESMWNPDKNYT
jgi:hypothetical protein